MKTISSLVVAILVMNLPSEGRTIVVEHDFYFFGKIFHCALDQQALTNTPIWKVGEPIPPLSPGDAVQKAKQYLAQANFEDLTWSGPSKISLVHETDDYWIYETKFHSSSTTRDGMAAYSENYPIITLIVLMNGKVVPYRQQMPDTASPKTHLTNAIIGSWHLISLDIPANEWQEGGIYLPDANLQFKSDGTFQSTMVVDAGTNKIPVPGSGKWSLSNDVLHITGASPFSHSNLVMRIQISEAKLTFQKDPVIFPYAFKSVYERTTNNLPGP